MPDSIHQERDFQASPEAIYEALIDSERFSALTGGAPADISREEGGSFSCFGDRIRGRNVELVPGRRIVQAWRAGDWDEGVYSLVRLELKEQGAGTRLLLDQFGFPQEAKPHLEGGWEKMYWEPLRSYLDKPSS